MRSSQDLGLCSHFAQESIIVALLPFAVFAAYKTRVGGFTPASVHIKQERRPLTGRSKEIMFPVESVIPVPREARCENM